MKLLKLYAKQCGESRDYVDAMREEEDKAVARRASRAESDLRAQAPPDA